jgi:hypothetical protein
MVDVLAPLVPPLRLIHALAGVLLVGGLLGRWVALAHAERAARAADLVAVTALLGAASVFEWIVIRSSVAVLVLGVLTAWAGGYPLLLSPGGGGGAWLPVSLLLFLSTIPLVPLVFLPRGRVFGAALEEARALGRVTPALVVAFGDPVARTAHLYEFAVVVVVLVLMFAKPF